MSPFVQGRHVYDYGKVLSSRSVTTAEALAARIEATGGGRVVIYTATSSSDLPNQDALAKGWHIDGMLLTASSNDNGTLTEGASLKGKLNAQQAEAIDSSPGPQTAESWMLTTLARVDAFLDGTHVFDGTGALDATGWQKAETAAKDLSAKIGAPVYIDIAIGGDDPSTAAFFNGASLSSDFDNSLVIALGVSGTKIGGYVDSSGDLFDKYSAGAPWGGSSLSNETATGGDVQAALLAAIDAVQSGSPFNNSPTPGDILPVVIFVIVIVVFSITAPFVWGPWLMRKLTGTTGPIKNGVPSDAVIESITDTGTTVSMPSVGPDAPEYKFGLQVTAVGGGAPYQVEVKALVPRLYTPMVVPGARIGVLIDPTNPMKVSLDFSRINAVSSAAGAGAAGVSMSPAGPGGFAMNFDASGQPSMGDVAAVASGVRSGSVNTIKGSAAQLLATGTHGTAVITTAMPLGKSVRDINPAADPSSLNDPVWLFTVEVSLAGEAPFPAVFGHRVPLDKVASVAPGVKLAVAVDQANRNQEVAIDWDKSPLAGAPA